MSKLKAPVYDGTISFAKYVRKVEKFRNTLNQEKYNTILEFINDLLQLDKESKMTSLLEFKKIEESEILKSKNKSLLLLTTYQQQFEDMFHLKMNIDPEKEKYIIYVLTKVLSKIDYSLTHKIKKSGTYYTITQKKRV